MKNTLILAGLFVFSGFLPAALGAGFGFDGSDLLHSPAGISGGPPPVPVPPQSMTLVPLGQGSEMYIAPGSGTFPQTGNIRQLAPGTTLLIPDSTHLSPLVCQQAGPQTICN